MPSQKKLQKAAFLVIANKKEEKKEIKKYLSQDCPLWKF